MLRWSPGAEWYHDLVDSSAPATRIERDPARTLLMLYTGGTTGNPKGVVWRHVDLFGALAFTAYASAGIEVPSTVADVGRVAGSLQAEGRSPVMLCAPPLMHGTALFLAIGAFVMGGSVVLLGGRSFDADELWDLVERHRVTQISLVGDAFARPMNEALAGAEAARPHPRPHLGHPHRVDRCDALGRPEASVPASPSQRDDPRHDRRVGGRPLSRCR